MDGYSSCTFTKKNCTNFGQMTMFTFIGNNSFFFKCRLLSLNIFIRLGMLRYFRNFSTDYHSKEMNKRGL